MARGNYQAFTYATIWGFAGGAGYLLERHTPSLVGGMALSVGFLGAGLLVLTDTIMDHHFDHITSLTMSGAMSAGYHMQQLHNPPRKMRDVSGAPPVPSSYD